MASDGNARGRFWTIVLAVLILDAATKVVAERALAAPAGFEVFGDYVQLRLVHNMGAAFGLSLGLYSRWIFLVVASIATVALYRWARETPSGDWVRQTALGLVAGGAVGNLIDRIRGPQGVVDFLDIGVGALRWPTFNVADIGVSCGAVLLALSLWLEDARRAKAESPTVG